MNFYLKLLQQQGFPIQKAQVELQKMQNLSAEAFHQYQETQRWNIFEYHRKNNNLYKQLLFDTKIKNWTDIPILTKQDVQAPLEQRLSDGYHLKNVYINNTSGSSGKPFFFAKDKAAHARTWALILDRYRRHGLEYGKAKQARFFGIPLSWKGYWKEQLKDRIANRVRFPVFDLSDPIVEKYTRRFRHIAFEYLYGYTSSLVLFAKYLQQQGLILKNICPSLQYCITTSEMCNELDRALMAAAFGVPVINEYGAAEIDLIAFEDADFDWIVSNENVLIEILDEQNQPVAPGQSGRLIVTALYNQAMPFIRYELGDVGALAPHRKGNYQILQHLQGRVNDVAILPSGKKSPGLTFYYISKNLLEKGGFMKEFIIKQIATDTFHFEYIADREINEREREQVLAAMAQYLEPGLTATFERKTKIERTPAGKLKHFHRLI